MRRNDRAGNARRPRKREATAVLPPPRPADAIGDTEDDSSSFLPTYADLVTLLLAFFIMLYGMSDTDATKFDGAAASIRHALGAKETSRARDAPIGRPGGEALLDQRLSTLHRTLSEQLSDQPVRLQRDDQRLRIQVDDRALFRSGSADLVSRAEALFHALTRTLQPHKDCRIHIEGHTDNQPISTPRYPSNWELSAIRATTVLRMLIEMGIEPTRLTATGYGDLLPLWPNDTHEHRAKNRRVELVLEMETKR